MRLSTIKIGNKSYSIGIVDVETFNVYLSQKNIFDNDVKSFIDYDEQIILIKNSYSKEYIHELLIHELLHACFTDSGFEQDEMAEKLISVLSPRIACLLADNEICKLQNDLQL